MKTTDGILRYTSKFANCTFPSAKTRTLFGLKKSIRFNVLGVKNTFQIYFPLEKEDYTELQTCLNATFSQVEELQNHGLTVNGVHYSVTW